MCFVLKHGNLDKFESRSSVGVLLGYSPHDRSYCVFNLETTPCLRDVFECSGDKELVESIFVDEEVQGFDGDEDDPLHPSTLSPEPILVSTLEAEAPQATTFSIAVVEASWVEGEIISQ
jgi:hypothetical protein